MTTPIEAMSSSNLPVIAGVEESLSAATRVNPEWELRFGTVRQLNASVTASVFVVLDNDIAAIPAISLVGRLAIGDRVGVVKIPPSGNYVISTLTFQLGDIIARGRRVTNQTSAGAESGVLRLDGIRVFADHAYQIYTSTLNLSPSTSGLTAEARIRIDTTGAQASSASTQIGTAELEAVATFVPRGTSVLATEYYPTANGFLSVFFGWILTGGAGTVTLLGSTTRPVSLYVQDMGKDVGTASATIL